MREMMIFPCIYAIDVDTSVSWYEDFLDFKCVFKDKIKRAECALIEKQSQKIYIISSYGEQFTSAFMIVEVDDLKKEYKKLEKRGLIFTTGIEPSPFGKKQFMIKDYDHNKIIYLQSA